MINNFHLKILIISSNLNNNNNNINNSNNLMLIKHLIFRLDLKIKVTISKVLCQKTFKMI